MTTRPLLEFATRKKGFSAHFRVHKLLIPALTTRVKDEKRRDCNKKLKKIKWNKSPNKSTEKSRFQLLFDFVNRHNEGEVRQLTIGDDV